MTPKSPIQTLEDRLRELGIELSVAFRELVEPLTGTSPRAGDVVSRLGIDKTQAWRLVRVMEVDNPFEALHESASPKGLSLIVEAAQRQGGDAAAVTRASSSVEHLADVIGEFPDGRAGLDAALARHVPKAKEAADRDARRKIVQGMSQVFGVRARARYIASVVSPSLNNESSCDVTAVAGYLEFRRLREGPRPIVFSGRHYSTVPGSDAPALLTLDGDSDSDPRLRYLEEFSTLEGSDFELETRGPELRLLLDENTPAVNEPVNMFFGQQIVRTLKRYRIDERGFEVVNHLLKSPSDVAVFDTLVHKDIYTEADPPRVTVERFGFNPAQQSSRIEDEAFRVDQELETQSLGTGLGRTMSRDVQGLPELLAAVCERIGQDPADFRVYRSRQVYPLPGFSVVMWYPLPEAKTGAKA